MVSNSEDPPGATGENSHVNRVVIGGMAKCIVQKVEHGSIQPALVTQQPSLVTGFQRKANGAIVRKRSNAAPGVVDQVFQADRNVSTSVLGEAVFKPRKLQQILHHHLEPLQLPLKTFHQHKIL